MGEIPLYASPGREMEQGKGCGRGRGQARPFSREIVGGLGSEKSLLV